MKNNEPAYRIELAEQDDDIPEELTQFATGDSWCIVRTHDDEPMSMYGSKEEAEAALNEMLTAREESEVKGE